MLDIYNNKSPLDSHAPRRTGRSSSTPSDIRRVEHLRSSASHPESGIMTPDSSSIKSCSSAHLTAESTQILRLARSAHDAMGFTFAQNLYAGASKPFANAFRQHASHGSKTRWCEGFLREKTSRRRSAKVTTCFLMMGLESADSMTQPVHTSGGGAMRPGRARKDACSRLRERRHQLQLGSIAASVGTEGRGGTPRNRSASRPRQG